MSVGLKIVGASSLYSSAPNRTDWLKCFLCQTDTTEKLICPAISNHKYVGAGYKSVAEDIASFSSAQCLPRNLDNGRLDDGSGVESTLAKFSAKFHKTCRLECSKSRLKRTVKRIFPSSETVETSTISMPKKVCIESIIHKPSISCLICEKPESVSDPLHAAMTCKTKEKVKQCAIDLVDERLLAKFSNDNLMPNRFNYHKKCMSSLYFAASGVKTREKAYSSKSNYDQAFNELVHFIEDTVTEQEKLKQRPVFRLSDLKKKHTDRLIELGELEVKVHATRLKKQILDNLPEMKAIKDRRHVLITSAEDVGFFVGEGNETKLEGKTATLAKAARIIRKEIKKSSVNFNGYFGEKCQEQCVPSHLLSFISMLLYGVDVKNQALEKQAQTTLSLCQLLLFNTKAKTILHSEQKPRHNKSREPPLPVYIGILLHNKTRKRELVDKLFELGLSVSYDRVLEISTDVGTKLCDYYEHINSVCPPQLKKSVFTTAAIDNINHQTSSTSAKGSFNGTGISVFQHFDKDTIDDTLYQRVTVLNSANDSSVTDASKYGKCLPRLPQSYTHIDPVIQQKMSSKVPTIEGQVTVSFPLNMQALQQEYQWLQHVSLAVASTDEPMTVSWSAYHAQDAKRNSDLPDMSCMLPLLKDDAASVATIRHSLDIIKNITELTNPGQLPVIAIDQPLFAIAKNIQWKWPAAYGESKFVMLFGGLHIEAAAFKAIGKLLDGSGWTDTLVQAGITTAGVADSFLKSSHIKRTRKAHQITACALYLTIEDAYRDCHHSDNLEANRTLDEWCESQKKLYPTFNFWYTVLQFELTILLFIRSIRTGNFPMYLQALTKLVGWFFILDHYNYARWISVHLRDMANLQKTHPAIHSEFLNGHFTVRKTIRAFSNIAIDQAHEQNNALVKEDGGAVGLTESPAALQRWMVSGPEMARLIREFESSCEIAKHETDVRHLDERSAVQSSFLQDVKSLKNMICQYGNPFLERNNDLLVLDTRDIVDRNVSDTIRTLERRGQEQYEVFVNERLLKMTTPLEDPIRCNSLPLFNSSKVKNKSKSKQLVSMLRGDVNLFSRLYVACQVRDGNLRTFFSHENQAFPPSISDMGKLRLGTKSDIVRCLEDQADPEDQNHMGVDVIILDGPVIVNMLKPTLTSTFRQYVHEVFMPYITKQLDGVQRVDLVWDEYIPDSLKAQTREKRGKGCRRRVEPNNGIPRNWNEFLRDDDNKTELFDYISNEVVTLPTDKCIITTQHESVACNQPINIDGLSPCSHEESDSRMMVHVAHASKEYKNIMIRTVDSDVVVLALYTFGKLEHLVSKLWVAFGTGKHFRLIPIHKIFASLGPEKCNALPMFHAFTGCDNTSCFAGKGKKTAWDTWNLFPAVTDAFAVLMQQPVLADIDAVLGTIERFCVLLYDKTSSRFLVNDTRLDLFAHKGRDVINIPPTQDSLRQHVRRAAYQAGHCWSKSVEANMQLISPNGWGWKKDENEKWEVIWGDLPEASKACRELLSCGCTKGCRGQCKCKKALLKCTALCKCGGLC